MIVTYVPETLETTMEPESEDERMLVLLMIKAFQGGGKITAQDNRRKMTTHFRPTKETPDATRRSDGD